jgi:hypothetical protein
LHDEDYWVRDAAAKSLGQLGIKETIQLYQVLLAIDRRLRDGGIDVRQALLTCRQLLDGRTFPGYQWRSLRERQAQRRWLKPLAWGLSIMTAVVGCGLTAMSLFGHLARHSFTVHFLTILAGIMGMIAVSTSIWCWKLRDPWKR